jgi:hypothetical protein
MMMYLRMDSDFRKRIFLKIMARLVYNKYEPREWPKDLIEVMTDFKKKPKATQCRDHPAVSFIAHRAKRVARILIRKFGSNLGVVL